MKRSKVERGMGRARMPAIERGKSMYGNRDSGNGRELNEFERGGCHSGNWPQVEVERGPGEGH